MIPLNGEPEPGAKFSTLLWIEAIKALLDFAPGVFALGWIVLVGNRSNEGMGGLVLEFIALFTVCPVLAIIGKFHFKSAMLLFRRQAPNRSRIVTASVIEGAFGLGLWIIAPTMVLWPTWTALCGFEVYLILSERGRLYWSSDASPSSASSTSG